MSDVCSSDLRFFDRRIVDDDVETAEHRYGMIDGGGPLRLVGDIMPDIARASAADVDLGRGRLALFVGDVAENHACAVFGKKTGDLGADAARCARNQGNLPSEIDKAHGHILLVSCFRAGTVRLRARPWTDLIGNPLASPIKKTVA